MNSKAYLILRFAGDLDIDKRRILRPVTRVAHVGKGLLRRTGLIGATAAEPEPHRPDPAHQPVSAEHESASVHIGHRLSLAVFNFLARIVAV
jgi:hypothetical protein